MSQIRSAMELTCYKHIFLGITIILDGVSWSDPPIAFIFVCW